MPRLKTMAANIHDISGRSSFTVIRSSTCSVHQHLVTYWSAEKHHLPPALTPWLPASALHAAERRPPQQHIPRSGSLSRCLPSNCALLTWVPSARRDRPSTWVSGGDTPMHSWPSGSGRHTSLPGRHWRTSTSRRE